MAVFGPADTPFRAQFDNARDPYTARNAIGAQPLDADLTAIAALTGTNTIYYRSADDTWSPVTFSGVTFTGGVLSVTARDGFKANRNGSSQGISTNTYTKLQCGTEVFDTNSKFDSSTNYRWTPAAGHVVLMGSIGIDVTAGYGIAAIYKNGSALAYSGNAVFQTGGLVYPHITTVDNANGTDYYELFGFCNTGSGGTVFLGATTATWFAGHAVI